MAGKREEGTRLTAAQIHENILRPAEHEIRRPAVALFWSSLASGMVIGFSCLASPYEVSADALHELRRRYFVDAADLEPGVYWRLTDNWLEMSVRFVTRERGVRAVKDAITREVLAGLEAAGIVIASATFELTGLPPVRLAASPPARADGDSA